MNWFLQKLYGLLFWRTPIGEILTSIYSTYLHIKFSFYENNPGSDKARLTYYLNKHYHIIEKGLALPSPRISFGEEKIRKLIVITDTYILKYGEDPLTSNISETLKCYLSYHYAVGGNINNDFKSKIERFLSRTNHTKTGIGGTRTVTRDGIAIWNANEFEKFVSCRYSVRDFDQTPIENETVISAINTAKNTPSVCNRQGWKVHFYSDKSLIKHILSFQNGNTGFTDCIDKLIIITGDTKAFTRYEHNQLFIDGGLFSMNLMLSLHAAGLGCCPLNTCFPFHYEKQVRNVAEIPDHERLIMMLAIGNLKNSFNVAISAKNNINQFLTIH